MIEITELDAVYMMKGYPLSVLTEAYKQMMNQCEDGKMMDLQREGIEESFSWSDSDEGYDYWWSVVTRYDRNFGHSNPQHPF